MILPLMIFEAILINIIIYNITLDRLKPTRYDILHGAIYTAITLIFIRVPYINKIIEPLLALLLLLTLILRRFNKYTLSNNIISACLTLIIITLSDALSSASLYLIFNQAFDANQIRTMPKLYLLLTSLNLIYGILLAYGCNRIKTYVLNYTHDNKLNYLRTIITATLLLIAIIFYWLTYNMNDTSIESNHIFIYSMVGILFATIVSVFSFMRYHVNKLKLKQVKKELTENKIYTKEIEKNQLALRSYKHDYRNMSLGLLSYIEKNDLEGIKRYYNEYFASYEAKHFKNDSRIDNLYFIKQDEINGLIWSKCIDAIKKGINLDIEIKNFIIYDTNLSDLIQIIGIWFDNAIEACQENDTIHLITYEQDTAQYFIIENPLHEKIDIMKLHSDNFTTKGHHRGLGLKTVNKILLANHDLKNNAVIEDALFKQLLIIKGS